MVYTVDEALQSRRKVNPFEDKKQPLEEHGWKSIGKVEVGSNSIAMPHACNAVKPTNRVDFNNIVRKVSLRYKTLLNTKS